MNESAKRTVRCTCPHTRPRPSLSNIFSLSDTHTNTHTHTHTQKLFVHGAREIQHFVRWAVAGDTKRNGPWHFLLITLSLNKLRSRDQCLFQRNACGFDSPLRRHLIVQVRFLASIPLPRCQHVVPSSSASLGPAHAGEATGTRTALDPPPTCDPPTNSFR